MNRLLRCTFLILGTGLFANCASNLSEGQPAKVLKGGEIAISNLNNVILPSQAAGAILDAGETIAETFESDTEITPKQQKDLVGSSTIIALMSPGYSNHLEVAVGLGYQLDAALRFGSGTYAASLRRGFSLDDGWDASVGVRGAYSSGTWLPYLDDLNSLVQVMELKRYDAQGFVSIGKEYGEWLRLWTGAKVIHSQHDGYLRSKGDHEISLTEEPIDEELKTNMLYYGGNLGLAIGFRWLFFVAELNCFYVNSPTLELVDNQYDLSGVVIAPTWGLRGVF